MARLHPSTRTRILVLILFVGFVVALALVVPYLLASNMLVGIRTSVTPAAEMEIDSILTAWDVVFWVGLAVVAGAGIVGALLLRHWFTAPLKDLAHIAARVATGEDVPFQAPDSPDAATLARALEAMRRRLRATQAETARQADEARIVSRFMDAVSFADDDDQVARALVGSLRAITGASTATVRFEERGMEGPPQAVGVERRAGAAGAASVRRCTGSRRGGVYLVEDPADALAIPCPLAPEGPGATACVPLGALGHPVGTVHLAWDQAGRPAGWDPARIGRLAAHGALAIANRRLLEELRAMAGTDPRTGLANSRTFDDALDRALATAGGEETNAVVLFDLDDFKGFNDRHGHAAGDEALRAFATVVRGSLREGDVAARYGGEEFVVLLRGVDSEGAVRVAERIRTSTAELRIAVGTGERASIRVSAGVAVAPMHGSERASLLLAADSALYAAKAGGRDRVELAWAGEAAEARGVGPGTAEEPVALIDLGMRVSGRSGRSRRS